MYNNYEEKLDRALGELLEGASLVSLVQKYSLEKSELDAYAKIVSATAAFKVQVPQAKGLEAVLEEMPAKNLIPVPEQTPSPYFSFFLAYRPALVLPVVVLLIIGGGFLLRPSSPGLVPNETPSPGATEPAAGDTATQSAPADAQFSVPTNTDAPAQKKAVPENTMMFMSAPEMATATATSTASTSESVQP